MDLPLREALEKEEALFKKFSFVGTDNVLVAGNLKTGYTVNVRRTGESFSGPVGGCCTDDDGCSIQSEAGCDLIGGTYQGDGTGCDPNPCPGACCAADGSCTIETEEDCEGAGGTYQGNGTTCSPTGACCLEDDSCIIATEACCSVAGGTYQGDDTTCDPDPCGLPPCNGCGFDAFDGSGRKFLTRTTRYQDSGSSDGTPRTANFTTDATEIATIDPSDCSISYSRSGGSSGTDDPVATCSRDLVSSAPGPGPFGTATCQPLNEAFLASHFFGTQSPTCTPCWWVIVCIPATNANETSNTNTDTTHDITYSCSDAHSSATASWHVELSDECTPDGMSPPP